MSLNIQKQIDSLTIRMLDDHGSDLNMAFMRGLPIKFTIDHNDQLEIKILDENEFYNKDRVESEKIDEDVQIEQLAELIKSKIDKPYEIIITRKVKES